VTERRIDRHARRPQLDRASIPRRVEAWLRQSTFVNERWPVGVDMFVALNALFASMVVVMAFFPWVEARIVRERPSPFDELSGKSAILLAVVILVASAFRAYEIVPRRLYDLTTTLAAVGCAIAALTYRQLIVGDCSGVLADGCAAFELTFPAYVAMSAAFALAAVAALSTVIRTDRLWRRSFTRGV
jgi:hypothetical protein